MFFTVKQAHAYLGCAIGINRVRSMMTAGIIPSTFDGKKYLTTQKQLDQYVKTTNAEIEIKVQKLKKAI